MNQPNRRQLVANLFQAADAVLGASIAEQDVAKIRELLATGLVKIHIECVFDESGTSEVIGTITQPGRKTGCLFHFTKNREPEERQISEPGAFIHSL